MPSVEFNTFYNQFLPWIAQFACISIEGLKEEIFGLITVNYECFISEGECRNNIFISFDNILEVSFKNEFLPQFLPWLVTGDLTVLCLELIGNRASKRIEIDLYKILHKFFR
jgi:hypothetical protein